MSNLLYFVAGTVFGMAVAQNYDVPDVKKKYNEFLISIEKNKK